MSTASSSGTTSGTPGQYPLASYSLLYYFPAAVVGNLPLVFAAAVAATLLFAFISYREWGASARWPTRIFGVLAAAPMFTGLYTYTLGFAAMLAALWLLQRGKTGLVVALRGADARLQSARLLLPRADPRLDRDRAALDHRAR